MIGWVKCVFLPFRFRWASGSSKWPRNRPREPEEGLKELTEGPKSAPRGLRETTFRAPEV
eukprot:1270134-Pyramimonas_sp.AAC.1